MIAKTGAGGGELVEATANQLTQLDECSSGLTDGAVKDPVINGALS